MKKALSVTIVVLGALLLMLGFIFWGSSLDTPVLIIDVVATVTAYILITGNLFEPWIKSDDPAQSHHAAMGIRWTTTWLYTLCAIAGAIVMHHNGVEWKYQLMVQGVLLLLLIIAWAGWTSAARTTRQVHSAEKQLRRPVVELRSLAQAVQYAAQTAPGLSRQLAGEIEQVAGDMRYLSPLDTPQARELDADMARELQLLTDAITHSRHADIPAQLTRLRAMLHRRRCLCF